MKLRNKKTGEIIDVYKGQVLLHYNNGRKTIHFKSLKELEEWEDYEEMKGIQKIHKRGTDIVIRMGSEEEAEKAAEKLKAFKRLRDKGLRFIDWELDMKTIADGKIWFDLGGAVDVDTALEDKSVKASMNLLFGGEE